MITRDFFHTLEYALCDINPIDLKWHFSRKIFLNLRNPILGFKKFFQKILNPKMGFLRFFLQTEKCSRVRESEKILRLFIMFKIFES